MTDDSDEHRDAVEQDDEKPLYERDEYQPDNTVDLVLLLAAEDGATYASVREQLEEIEEGAMHIQVGNTGDPIPPDLGPEAQPEHREPDRALRFLTLHDYVDAYDSWGDAAGAEVELTNRGHSAVDALRRGLLPEQREALEDVGADTAPRVTDGGTPATATRRAERDPTIYDVVELPESEKGDTCPMMVGERDDIEICGNPTEYLFVYEASVKPGDDRRKNCLACEDCKPGVTARV